jgi:hypothetical protein
MMASVPNVIHSHEPEPLTALAGYIQEPATQKAVLPPAITTDSPSATQKTK